MDIGDGRHHYIVLHDGREHHAYCSCGWTSPPAVNGGIAGALWDMHVDAEHTRAAEQMLSGGTLA